MDNSDKKDATTQTSHYDSSTSTLTSTETSVTIIPSKELTAESSKETLDEAIADVKKPKLIAKFASSEDDSDSDEKPHSKNVKKYRKSKQVRTIGSPVDSDEPEGSLDSSKSRPVRNRVHYSDDDSSDALKEANSVSSGLRKGNVFVYMVVPPDGGYGWFIIVISFLCQVVIDGIILTVGIILPAIAKEFDVPGSKIVLLSSMQLGFYFMAGTISSAFINKFGFRPVALAGCLFSITVLTISTFSVNLPMMLFFYSFLGGPGLSMIWVPSQLIIGYYFEKYRPIASGISCSGAGIGIMMFAFMNSVLVPELGWRNLMRLHVGCLVVVFILGLSYIEVAPTRIGQVINLALEDSESESLDMITDMTRYTRYTLKMQDLTFPLEDDFQDMIRKMDDQPPKKLLGCCNRCFKLCCAACCGWLERRREKKGKEMGANRYIIKRDLIDRQDFFYMGPMEIKEPTEAERLLSTRLTIADGSWRTISLEKLEDTYKVRSVVNTLSTMHMKRDQKDYRYKSYAELRSTLKNPLLTFLSPQNLIHPKIRRVLNLLFDTRLLAIGEFQILLLSAFLFPMGFNIPLVYSTVRVQIDPFYANLITPSIGFSNFAFRIASGFIAMKYREHTTIICGGGMCFGGLSVLVSAFYGLDVVWFQFVYAICYGIAPAFYSTLRSILYVRYLGLEKLTNAFGLISLAMGLGIFIGTTTGGILNDLTGNYTASFVFAGLCICIAGFLKLYLPVYNKHANAKKVKNLQK